MRVARGSNGSMLAISGIHCLVRIEGRFEDQTRRGRGQGQGKDVRQDRILACKRSLLDPQTSRGMQV